ncbi:MAG: hypothetical protein LBT26_01785 [Clostridiales Family XIII bacterium]|jgi:hypothetical protein|nr:hypothetical protein [Clostridiales Family XIII bacterium]
MALTDVRMAVVILIFLAVLLIIAAVGYNKNYKGKPQDEVVIPPAPQEDE